MSNYRDPFIEANDDETDLFIPGNRRRRRKNYLPVVIAIALVIVLGLGGVIWFVLSDKDDPAIATIPTGAATVATGPAAPAGRTAMTPVEIAAYVEPRAVTVKTDISTGSGFFIDDNGTIVTNFHVIDGATYMQVTMYDGANYEVTEVIDFAVHHDVAVLRIKHSGNLYLEACKDEVKKGESVYAIGASRGLEGTFSTGVISNIDQKRGAMKSIQTDAAISQGNSGGPLVNQYGEVVGINSYLRNDGQNLNFAVRIDTLDMLTMDKNYTINQYVEWYTKETMRSYRAVNGNYVEQTMFNTYQHVTGVTCLASLYDDLSVGTRGYDEHYSAFQYEYDAQNYDKYTDYLNTCGFELVGTAEGNGGTVYQYLEGRYGTYMDILITSDEAYLVIAVHF